MTQNQIAYWNLQETKRSNQAKEAETSRHNLSTEGETVRHNMASENIDLSQLNETVRANKARETETLRSNMANEAIKQEQNRISSASLAETMTHNAALREKMGYENLLTQANVDKVKQDTELSTAKTAQTYVDLGFAPAALVTKYSQAAQHLAGLTAASAAGASTAQAASTGSAIKSASGTASTIKSSNPLTALFVLDQVLEMNKITPNGSGRKMYN